MERERERERDSPIWAYNIIGPLGLLDQHKPNTLTVMILFYFFKRPQYLDLNCALFNA